MTRWWCALLPGTVLLLPCLSDGGDKDAEDKAARAVERLGGKLFRDDMAAEKSVIQVILNGRPATDTDVKVLNQERSVVGGN
jgi:hypothetical protein